MPVKAAIPYDPGAPLVAWEDGFPTLFATYGVMLHLEPLAQEDGDRLETVNALVRDWFGGALRWTMTSVTSTIDPFRPEDLDYISGYPSTLPTPSLDLPAEEPVPAGVGIVQRRFAAASHERFAVYTHGGAAENHASPYSYRFYADVLRPELDVPVFETASFIRVTVPVSCPVDELRDRALRIAHALRVRWGAAGYMYSGWELGWRRRYDQAVYAHARRHSGFDVGIYENQMPRWHEQVRTVSWLTFLGPSLRASLAKIGMEPRARGPVQVYALGDALVLQAGERPEEGDVNRLALPAAYTAADAMVRPIRAAERVHFGVPWTERSTEDWLRRFEKRLG